MLFDASSKVQLNEYDSTYLRKVTVIVITRNAMKRLIKKSTEWCLFILPPLPVIRTWGSR